MIRDSNSAWLCTRKVLSPCHEMILENPNRSLSCKTWWSFHGNVGSPWTVDTGNTLVSSGIWIVSMLVIFLLYLIRSILKTTYVLWKTNESVGMKQERRIMQCVASLKLFFNECQQLQVMKRTLFKHEIYSGKRDTVRTTIEIHHFRPISEKFYLHLRRCNCEKYQMLNSKNLLNPLNF